MKTEIFDQVLQILYQYAFVVQKKFLSLVIKFETYGPIYKNGIIWTNVL